MTRKITMMLAAVLCLASCQDQYGRFDPQRAQGSVKFHLGMEGVESKAVYSGEVAGNVERIDWQSGDAIGIYCAQVKEDKYARYVVKSDGTYDEDNKGVSKGEALPDGPELVWGEDVAHVFYSYFPEKAENGIATGMSGATVSATLPATQAVKGAITNSVAAPDLKNMLMTAKSPEYTPVGGACEAVVSLDFVPLTTAVQFTITNQTKAAMTVASVSLTSASGALNGPFTVDISDMSDEHQPKAITLGSKTISYSHTYPYCQYTGTVTDATRTVSIEFDTPVTLTYDADPAKSGKLTFTFFLQPCQNFDDLTFRVTKDDKSWMQTRLGYTDGSGIVFPRFMKSKVDGIFVPEGAQWTVKYGPDVDPWNPEGGNVDPMPEIVTDPVVTSWDTGVEDDLELKDPYNGHEYVEIAAKYDGTNVTTLKWATCNVGAASPKEYGWYFAWGGTVGYEYDSTNSKWVKASDHTTVLEGGFNWQNCPYHTGISSSTGWTKYIPSGRSTYWSGTGSPDNKLVLDLEDDAARVNWGGSWRMPTSAEFKAMKDATYWKWDDTDKGDYVYAPNPATDAGKRNSGTGTYKKANALLFFPAAGNGSSASFRSAGSGGSYWSRNLGTSDPSYASHLYISSSYFVHNGNGDRNVGQSVRPVSD